MGRNDICSSLGYEIDKPTKDRRNLLKATSAFLADYEARGSKVYGKKAESSIGGRLCAMNFLEEEGRGERFWPPTSDGSLVYEEARDKDIIIDSVAELFLIHAKSNHSKLQAKRRSQKHNDTSPPSNVNNEHMSNKPLTSIVPEETYFEDEEPQFTYSSSVMTIEPELCLAPWLDPPKRFDRNVAVPWVESLNPKSLPGPPLRLGKKWLSQENVRWPAAVDREIQYFMHRWLFYYTVDLENGTDDGIQCLVNLLRNDNGTSPELDVIQLREFRKRIVERVKFFTETFINHQFVEVQEGVPQMTARFRNIWTTLKYETPTPRINYRRRSVEDEAPRESPRKRRKLSKKAEDNALDICQPKRKPWSEHAWRRKTIPPPPDMTFPNLLPRKSSNIDPVTMVESPRSAIDEEGCEGEVSEECEIHERFESLVRNSKISVEIPPPNNPVFSESGVIIKMEEESTIEVSQLKTTVIKLPDDEYNSETIKVVPPTHGEITKASSPNPDDIPIVEKTPPYLQIEPQVCEAHLPLPHQLNDTSEDRGLPQQPQTLSVSVIANQPLEIVAVGPPVIEISYAQSEVNGSAQLSPKADNANQLPQSADASSSPAINETSHTVVKASTQPMDLDEDRQSPKGELMKSSSSIQVADETDGHPRGVILPQQTAKENVNNNASNSTLSSVTSSTDSPKKYGPFNDLESLNKLFSSNGSRPMEAYRPRSTSSISPTSSAETHTREMVMDFSSVNAIRNSVPPQVAPSIELILNGDFNNKLQNQGEIPVASQATMEGLKASTHGPDATQHQFGGSGHDPLLDVLETSQKSLEKNEPSLTRTPLPSVPLTSENDQKMTNPLPNARPSPNQSPQRPPQKPVQNSQAAFKEPLIPTFQPINRPMNGVISSPSNRPWSFAPEPPQAHFAPITKDSTAITNPPSSASQETQTQNQSQSADQNYKASDYIPAQNVVYEPIMVGTSSGPSGVRNIYHNPGSINTQNGVYPMAFIVKPTASNNGMWTQRTSRKRALEGTSTKPRKTKSRKKTGLPEKLAAKSATAQYPPTLPPHAGQNVTPPEIQTQSPPQPVHNWEHSPKPPHPELINHLRIMDEKMGVNSGASYQPALKTPNPPPSTSNRQPTDSAESIDRNMISYNTKQEQDKLNYIALQEKAHSISQDWGKNLTSVDVHHATSAPSTQPQRTPSTQIRTSLPVDPQVACSEQCRVEHGTQESKISPNVGDQSRTILQSDMQQNRPLPNVSDQGRMNAGAGITQNKPSSDNSQSKTNIERRHQPSNSAHLGYSKQALSLETGTRHGTFTDNGTRPTISKGAPMTSSNPPQNFKEPQGTQHSAYNNVRQSNPPHTNQHSNQESQPPNNRKPTQKNPSSPESYQSQDPWWNSLAADYNIKRISQPTSRLVPHSDTNILQNRLVNNENLASTVQTPLPVQVGNQASPPNTAQVAPEVSERPRSTGSQASKVYRQTTESQHTDHHSVQSSNAQGSPARSYSGNQYATQPSLIQRSNSAGQSAQPPSAPRTSTPNSQFSNQASSQPSNGRVPSPKNQFYQPPSQPSNLSKTSSKGQGTMNTAGQPPNTQTTSFQHQRTNQPPIQPATLQKSVPPNQFANRPPAQFSPIQASSPQNQYSGSPVIQQASSPPVPYNTEYERQNQGAPQYQYPKRPPQQAETQTFTTQIQAQAQQKMYSGQKPLDWTQYRLSDPRAQTTLNSASSSPRQPTPTTNQAANTPPVRPSTIQMPMTQSALTSTIPTILNRSLPPTPPTPAVIPNTKLDNISQYPTVTHPLAAGATRQQIPTVIPTPRLDNVSRYPLLPHSLEGGATRQQSPAIIPTPKLDIMSQSITNNSLATPQHTPTTPQAVGAKLDFYLQRSNSTIETTSSFSYHYMEALSLSNLFSLFSQRSGVPMEKLDELTFRCMFGEYQQFVVGKNMGDGEWKRVRKRIWRNWDREVRAAKQNGEDDEEEFWEVNILIGRRA
ncbi:hypothetical protein NHQ30_011628 [Ciborinia camelliae]|nr:hypothetical protein NHQ30_011628 [Ciborinia camelliae]